jgi:adenosine deaminase
MISVTDVSRVMPKVEIHCHLEGTVRPGTLAELARKHQVDLGAAAAEDLYEFTDLKTFFRLFRAAQSVLRIRDDWARIAYESVIDSARANVIYREAFISPAYFLGSGQKIADIIAGLAEGLAAGEKDTGVRTMLIGGIDRAFGPAAGVEFVESLIELRRQNAEGTERLIGVGMDGIELGSVPSDYQRAFSLAGAAGLRLTSHQGAEGPPSNITDALDILRCERIDHGLAVLDDPALTERARSDHIAFNVCPSSNLSVGRYPSLQDHPFPAMRRAGLRATLNSDDPAFTRIDLADEYATVAETFGLTWEEMLTTALDAVEATWLSDSEKGELRSRINQYAADLSGVFTHSNALSERNARNPKLI